MTMSFPDEIALKINFFCFSMVNMYSFNVSFCYFLQTPLLTITPRGEA